jgi:hypothetical protein
MGKRACGTLEGMRPPLFVRPLTDAERQAVTAGLRSSDAFVLRRCQILFASACSERAPRIAEQVGCDESDSARCAARLQCGWAGLPAEAVEAVLARPPYALGLRARAGRSRPEQAERLRALLHRSPRDFGKPGSLWALAWAAEVSVAEGIVPRRLCRGDCADARAAGIPFRLVVADSVYGENLTLEAQLSAAHIPYIMGLRPSPDSAHGAWQQVDDPANPPAFTPAEAAARLSLSAWRRTVRFDSHGKELIRYIAELELGPSYGPTKSVRLVAATRDPRQLKPESTWSLATSLPLAEVSAEQVYEIYRLRDWSEHYYKPVKHELGWADYQMRPERAIVRHWHLVLLAYTFSLLVGALPHGAKQGEETEQEPPAPAAVDPVDPAAPVSVSAGGKIRTSQHSSGHRRAHRVERDAASSTGVALPLGAAAALLETLVDRRPTARAGRAPRPRRAVPPT